MDTSQLNNSAFIIESRVISDEYIYTFNNKLTHAITDGWVQHGNIFAVGKQFAVNVVKYDPRYTKHMNTILTLVEKQIEQLGELA